MKRLIECVPNFSEGRDMTVIRQITDAIEAVEGIRLLDVDPGRDTHRTVVTFVGSPEAVCEAAFQAMRKAQEVIDMRHHSGAHPRFGATDVCPLIPLSGITMAETAQYARDLAKRVAEELDYPVYCYEQAAFVPARKNLAYVRAGEYEGLAAKLQTPEGKPDFGPAEFRPRTGATAVGARDFLIAYNINLNTTSVRRANSVAFDIREAGRILREGDPVSGEILRDQQGEPLRQPGTCKGVKAIGWYIPEYGQAQVSMNITDLAATPVHIAFDEACKSAQARGMRVTGSELVGMVPLRVLLEAGRYFLARQERSVGVSEAELVRIAVRSLGLDDLKPFDPAQKVIEYSLQTAADQPLVHMTVKGFADETASESPAPGGGSVSALAGSLAAALATMVANLSAHKRGWDDRWHWFSDIAAQGQALKDQLLRLTDEDTQAFNQLMNAFGLPKSTPEETAVRKAAIQAATRQAIEAPLHTMQAATAVFPLIEAMIREGNPNSVTDAGVAALCAHTAVQGAHLNVLVNLSGLHDKAAAAQYRTQADQLSAQARDKAAELEALVRQKL